MFASRTARVAATLLLDQVLFERRKDAAGLLDLLEQRPCGFAELPRQRFDAAGAGCGIADLGEVGFFQQHQLRVARGAAGERIGQSQGQRVRQYGDGVGAAEAGGEGRHRRAQHVHVGIALRQHAPRGIGRNEQRLRCQAAGLFDPRPQQPQRAEFCQRQKLIGIGGEPRIDHALRIFERDARLLDRAQIGDTASQHERQFLHLGSAGIMDHPSIGDGERALEAHRGKTLDRAGDGGHDLVPAIGTGAPHRTGPERVEPEADIAGGGIDAFALDVFGDVNGRHPRLRADLKLDADAGVEIDAVENRCYGFSRRIQPIAVGAGGA